MLTEELDYYLPPELIAKTPLVVRDESRLLVLKKASRQWQHSQFKNIAQYLQAGDLLVLNDTEVINARLLARRASGAQIEIFLLQPVAENLWQVLLKPTKRIQEGEILSFGENCTCQIVQKHWSEEIHLATFQTPTDFLAALASFGTLPLPPYLKTDQAETQDLAERYQTVFAKNPGAVAAPTAGLHFTKPLLQELAAQGIGSVAITLHVGYGTFKPLTCTTITEHKMHSEQYFVSESVATVLNQAKQDGRRLIAVGTTSARTLESIYQKGRFVAGAGTTDIFIYPGYTFQAIDGLLTNFHLPKSSLLALVGALAGSEFVRTAYAEAIREKYRFYSFGDAMLIIP